MSQKVRMGKQVAIMGPSVLWDGLRQNQHPFVGCWAGANTSAVVCLEKSVGTNPWLLVQLLAQNKYRKILIRNPKGTTQPI